MDAFHRAYLTMSSVYSSANGTRVSHLVASLLELAAPATRLASLFLFFLLLFFSSPLFASLYSSRPYE